GVEVRDVTLFNGRVFVDRIAVPARGLVGAHVEGLVADGKAYRVAPNTVVPMSGGSYLVALQEAVSPGRHGYGLVGLRAYVAAADPVHGFDCSGLMMYVYGLLGIKLYHYSGYQWYEGTRVPRAELQPGDLVFFHMGPNGPGHVGMYIGSGLFVQAPHTGDVVKVSSV